jgi:hypothetical protein
METNTQNTGVDSCAVCESTVTNTNVVIQKRGRGRPRKDAAPVAIAPMDATPKRGRGRPRKNPLPV